MTVESLKVVNSVVMGSRSHGFCLQVSDFPENIWHQDLLSREVALWS